MRINAIDFTVIGVAPEDFHSTDEYVRPYFYVPLSMEQRLQGLPKDPLADRSNHSLEVTARLKPGVAREAAQGELDSLWKGLQPLHTEADGHRLPHVRTELQARIHSSPDDAFLVALLMALTGVVLMIACANVANLLLGRARARTREIAIRMSLGISRARLVRQLLTESLVLALLGTALGLAFAYAGIRFLQKHTRAHGCPGGHLASTRLAGPRICGTARNRKRVVVWFDPGAAGDQNLAGWGS